MADETAGIDVSYLKKIMANAETNVKTKLEKMETTDDESIDIAAMFDVQLAMNKLSQVSEMSTGVAAGMHSTLASIARNVKS